MNVVPTHSPLQLKFVTSSLKAFGAGVARNVRSKPDLQKVKAGSARFLAGRMIFLMSCQDSHLENDYAQITILGVINTLSFLVESFLRAEGLETKNGFNRTIFLSAMRQAGLDPRSPETSEQIIRASEFSTMLRGAFGTSVGNAVLFTELKALCLAGIGYCGASDSRIEEVDEALLHICIRLCANTASSEGVKK